MNLGVSPVMAGSLVVLTGASASGKTTIALAIETAHPEFTVLRFDTIGVPSALDVVPRIVKTIKQLHIHFPY
ncbi:MAG: hypothetical protein WDM77_04950 [Steroidobacteraceae bacterium]